MCNPQLCRWHFHRRGNLLGIALLLSIFGCNQEASIGHVRGKVTLDGNPIKHATVTFQPANGATSFGISDNDGEYELLFSRDRPGAVVGMHSVSIETYRVGTDSDGNPKEFPETIPAFYNTQTELRREVKAGQQTIDFQLEG